MPAGALTAPLASPPEYSADAIVCFCRVERAKRASSLPLRRADAAISGRATPDVVGGIAAATLGLTAARRVQGTRLRPRRRPKIVRQFDA